MAKWVVLRNFADTLDSIFKSIATSIRTYTLQDRDGILADDTDLAAAAVATAAAQTAAQAYADGLVTTTITSSQTYTLNTLADADYTVLLSDCDPVTKFLVMNASTTRTVTLPNNTTAAIALFRGPIALLNIGAGTITIAAEAGATLENYSTVYTVPPGSMCTFLKRATNTWRLENVTPAVPTSRTIAGIDLADNITTAELVTALDGWTRVSLSGSVVVSTTAYADITGLLFPISSGTNVECRGELYYESANSTEGVKVDTNGPTLTSKFYVVHVGVNSTTVVDRISGAYDTTTAGNAGLVSGGGGMVTFSGKHVVSSSGNIQMRAGTETGGINVTFLAESYVEYRVL